MEKHTVFDEASSEKRWKEEIVKCKALSFKADQKNPPKKNQIM